MKTNRRSFLSLMGVAPMAAKAAADAEIAKQSKIGIDGFGGDSYIRGAGDKIGNSKVSAEYVPWEHRPSIAKKFIKQFGLPDVIEKRYRDQAKSIAFLDADIAVKKTWSLSVKIQHQRQRNYDALVNMIDESTWRAEKHSILEKLLGFEWPW